MTLHSTRIQRSAALSAGVLILFVPRILNYVVTAYLILVGILVLGADPLRRTAYDAPADRPLRASSGHPFDSR